MSVAFTAFVSLLYATVPPECDIKFCLEYSNA